MPPLPRQIRDTAATFPEAEVAASTDALLKEDGDYILLESGDKILLE